MIDETYKNRMWYYNLMKDFLEHKIKAFLFMERFLSQRNNDIDEDVKAGYYDYIEEFSDNELKFREECSYKLYDHIDKSDATKVLSEYVTGARKYGIIGPLFFSGIYEELFIDVRDFYPRNSKEAEIAGWDNSFIELTPEEYESEYNIDETELRRRIKEKFDILEKNKDLWL